MKDWAIAVALAVLLAPGAVCEPPSMSRLFPAGASLGSETSIAITGKFPNSDLQFWSSSAGLHWESLAESGMFRVKVDASATPGLCWVRCYDNHGVSQALRFVIGPLPEKTEVEPNNFVSEATSLDSLPMTVNGVLQKRGDVDTFSLHVEQDQTLVASVQANQTLNSGIDCSLQIIDMSGNVLAENLDYHGLDPHIIWKAPKTMEVAVRIFGFPAAPDSTIALAGNDSYIYRLTLTTGPFLEAAIPLALSRSNPQTMKPLGWNIPTDTTVDHTIDPETNADTFEFVMPGVPGAVAMRIVDMPILVEMPKDNPDETPGIPIPMCLTGCISTTDEVDSYWFEAEKDSMIHLRLESRSLGYPLDAVIAIKDPEGKSLARQDDTGSDADPSLSFKVPKTGRYQIEVADVNGFGSPESLYRLTAMANEIKSFSLSLAKEIFEGKAGEAIEIPVSIKRDKGMELPIHITAIDLPEGCISEMVVSEPKGDSSSAIILRVTAGSAVNHTFRVIGEVAESKSISKIAICDTGHSFPWLFVPPVVPSDAAAENEK